MRQVFSFPWELPVFLTIHVACWQFSFRFDPLQRSSSHSRLTDTSEPLSAAARMGDSRLNHLGSVLESKNSALRREAAVAFGKYCLSDDKVSEVRPSSDL